MSASSSVDASAADDAARLSALPVLASLACASAAIEFFAGRVSLAFILRFEGMPWVSATLLAAAFFRNLAAVAGAVALVTGVHELVRFASQIPLWRRIGWALVSGMFTPTLLLAVFLPRHRTTLGNIVLGVATAHGLAIALGVAALRSRAPDRIRIGVGLATVALLIGFVTLVAATVSTRVSLGSLETWIGAARNIGEVLLLAAPIAIGWAVRPRGKGAAMWAVFALGWGMLLVAGAPWAVLAAGDRELFATSLYGALRLAAFTEVQPGIYPLLLGTGLSFATIAALQRDRASRQVGVGLVLLCVAGYSPAVLTTLLYTVLAFVLIARGCIAYDGTRSEARQ